MRSGRGHNIVPKLERQRDASGRQTVRRRECLHPKTVRLVIGLTTQKRATSHHHIPANAAEDVLSLGECLKLDSEQRVCRPR